MKGEKRLFIFFGMIASGKSYLASRWANQHGYTYHNSDVVRKKLAGLTPEISRKEEVDQGIYTAEFSRKTYDELIRLVKADLTDGHYQGAVLDGSYQSRRERDLVFSKLGNFRPLFFYCFCAETVLKERMELRAKDPKAVSDGRWEIYLKQKERFELPDELGADQLVRIDTDRPLDEMLHRLDQAANKFISDEEK